MMVVADLEVSRYILVVKPIGFLKEMNVVCKRKKKSKMTSRTIGDVLSRWVKM